MTDKRLSALSSPVTFLSRMGRVGVRPYMVTVMKYGKATPGIIDNGRQWSTGAS